MDLLSSKEVMVWKVINNKIKCINRRVISPVKLDLNCLSQILITKKSSLCL